MMEQAIIFLESFLVAAVVLTGAGLLHKNESDSESSSCVDVEIDFINGKTPQQTLATPQNLIIPSEGTIEARQVGGQGVVYADLIKGALCNNLAAIFCQSPYGTGSIYTLYNKSILGFLTVMEDKSVTIHQKFNKCGSVFQYSEDGKYLQVYYPDGDCKLEKLYLAVDKTKRLVTTDKSKEAANFTFTGPTNCGLNIQC